MPDRSASRGSGKTAVCYERDCASLALTHYGGGRCEHLTHPGASLWSFKTDHYNIPVIYLIVQDGFACLLFAIKDSCRPFMHKHFRKHGRLLYDSPQRSQGPFHKGQSALFVIGVFHRTDNVVVNDLCLFEVLLYSVSRDSYQFSVYQAFFKESCHKSLDSPGLPEILDMVMPRRAHRTKMRNSCSDLVE